jgi:hypothetical protein
MGAYKHQRVHGGAVPWTCSHLWPTIELERLGLLLREVKHLTFGKPRAAKRQSHWEGADTGARYSELKQQAKLWLRHEGINIAGKLPCFLVQANSSHGQLGHWTSGKLKDLSYNSKPTAVTANSGTRRQMSYLIHCKPTAVTANKGTRHWGEATNVQEASQLQSWPWGPRP